MSTNDMKRAGRRLSRKICWLFNAVGKRGSLRTLTGIKDYESLQLWLNDYCEKLRLPGWHNDGPADFAEYEADELKIMMVNSESGGFKNCPKVPPDEYLKWIKNRWATPRYSSVLVTLIRDQVFLLSKDQTIPAFDYAAVAELYQNDTKLIDAMRKSIYMNARITSNDDTFPREEKGVVINEAKIFSEYRKRFIEILRPKIIVCSGDSALVSLFNDSRLFSDNSFVKNEVFIRDNFVIVAIDHLSRPAIFGGYENMHRLAVKCAQFYVELHGSL